MKASFDALQQQLQKMTASIGQLSADITNVNKVVSTIEQKVNELSSDVVSIKSDLATTNKSISSIQSKQRKLVVEAASQASAINRLEQLGMASDIALHNIPAIIDHVQFYTAMAQWSGNLLTEEKLKRCNLVLDKTKTFKSAYLTFWSEKDKLMFKRFVGKKKIDATKKYVPILPSQIFELDATNPQRAVPLEAKEPMTKMNRAIFNLLREKTSRKEANVYIANGLVNIRFGKDAPPIIVHSKEDVEAIVRKQASQKK
jgi:outer membrane murein-binding lipoprotein Lpp